MITVTFGGEEFHCAVAYKGADYIHLVDESGALSATFSGITDFSGFTISGGTWSALTDDDDCFIAVVKDDGTLSKGGSTCNDISTALTTADAAKSVADAAMPIRGGTFTDAVSAAPTADESTPMIRNIVVVEHGTDLNTLSVPAGTIVMVKKEANNNADTQ